MTDLKSQADELIAATGRAIGHHEERESRAALTRFVHALCECADLLKMAPCPSSNSPGHEQAWPCQWCDARNTALAALEKGEKV